MYEKVVDFLNWVHDNFDEYGEVVSFSMRDDNGLINVMYSFETFYIEYFDKLDELLNCVFSDDMEDLIVSVGMGDDRIFVLSYLEDDDTLKFECKGLELSVDAVKGFDYYVALIDHLIKVCGGSGGDSGEVRRAERKDEKV